MREGGGELRSQLSVSELPVVSCCVGFEDADGCGGDTHFSGVLSFSTNAHELHE